MPHDVKPHPLNVIGDFYVEDGCCTACEVPLTEAPDLFGITTDDSYHCFVQRQPKSKGEFDQMLSAIACAELQCIRYRGNDADIFSRLSAMDEMEICDNEPPPGTELGLRRHVTFETKNTPDMTTLASSFKAFVRTKCSEYSRISFPWFTLSSNIFTYKRDYKGWCKVKFEISTDRIHVSHDADDLVVTWHVYQWLSTLSDLLDIRWYTDDGWRNSNVWHHSHY